MINNVKPRSGIKQRLFRMHRYHRRKGDKVLPFFTRDWLRQQPIATQAKVAFVLLAHPVGVWLQEDTTMIYRHGEGADDMVIFPGETP